MTTRKKSTVLVFATYSLSDPITRNTINSISELYDHIVVVEESSGTKYNSLESKNIRVERTYQFGKFPRFYGLKTFLVWIAYRIKTRRLISEYKPDLVITFMLKPLAALAKIELVNLVSCIYDIPDPKTSGKLERIINKNGFKKLKSADIIWASDIFKSELAAKFAGLTQLPLVCHNCPSLANYSEMSIESKLWLRQKLRDAGANISDESGTVLIRAGAIGPYGGIEETLSAMQSMPDDCLFLMMGRPTSEYRNYLISLIKESGLGKKAFLWNKPDDNAWKLAIEGADIGHLIHLPPPKEDSIHAGLYKYNSSLSNNRLFTYMASAMPILSYNDVRLDAMHKDVNCFYLVDVSSLQGDIAKGWKELNENNELRKLLGAEGKKAFLTKYNWEFQFQGILDKLRSKP